MSGTPLIDESLFLRRNEGLVQHLVGRLAKRCSHYRKVPMADLMQAGRLGMLIAFRDYHQSTPVAKLSTYAANGVLWEIARQYGPKVQRDPLFRAWPIEDVPDPFDFCESIAEADDLRYKTDRLYAAIGRIRSRESLSICLRYGLGTSQATLETVGRKLGVTKERARQIIMRAENQILADDAFRPEREARDAAVKAAERRRYEDMLRRRAERENARGIRLRVSL